MAVLNYALPDKLTEYPNSFKRQGAFPLERYSVFYAIAEDTEKGVQASSAYQEALNYARNNPVAYIGQVISVVTVTDNVASVDVYKIVNKLSGTNIVADLELVGDAEAITAANAAIAGLTTRIQAAESSITALQEIVNGRGEGEAHVKGLAEKLADAESSLSTLSGSVGVNTTAIEQLGSKVDTHIENTKNYETRISTLESAGYATTGQVATAKSEAIEAAVTRVLGEGVNEDFDTLKEVAEWILRDTSGAANIITRLSAIEQDYLVGTDKEELQNNINTVDGKFTGVNESITDINNLIGSLPEGAVSTTVIAYIQEAINALNIGDYARISALNELAGTVSTLSGTVGGISTKANANESAITAINSKLDIGDTTISALLENKVDKVSGSRLINAAEIAKLEKLSIDPDTGDVGISATVSAGNVTGLPQKIADILDSTDKSGEGNEGALLNGKVDTRHLNSSLAALISGAVQANKLNTNEFVKDADGTISLNKVNMSKLEQTEGDWLILNGGDSTNSWN